MCVCLAALHTNLSCLCSVVSATQSHTLSLFPFIAKCAKQQEVDGHKAHKSRKKAAEATAAATAKTARVNPKLWQ